MKKITTIILSLATVLSSSAYAAQELKITVEEIIREPVKPMIIVLDEPAPPNACGPNKFEVMNPDPGQPTCIGKKRP